MYMVWYSRV